MRPSLQSDQPCSHTHLTRARCHSLLARCAVTNPSTASRSDADSATYETTIADRINGQRSKPLRVVMFNTDTDRAEDVSHAIAQARTCRWLDPTITLEPKGRAFLGVSEVRASRASRRAYGLPAASTLTGWTPPPALPAHGDHAHSLPRGHRRADG